MANPVQPVSQAQGVEPAAPVARPVEAEAKKTTNAGPKDTVQISSQARGASVAHVEASKDSSGAALKTAQLKHRRK